MDIITKTFAVFPFHQLSKVFIDGEYFCLQLEDIVRAKGQKVHSWTALPRTGMVKWYDLGIRYSPRFKREMISIYNQPDEVTVKANGMTFTYPMFHGGNDAFDTESCPLIGYNPVKRKTPVTYGNEKLTIEETVIQGTAEADFFNIVAPEVRAGNKPRLFML